MVDKLIAPKTNNECKNGLKMKNVKKKMENNTFIF